MTSAKSSPSYTITRAVEMKKDHLTLDDAGAMILITLQKASENKTGCSDRPGSTHISSQGSM